MISALAEVEAGALVHQVHLEHVEDTARFLHMFLSTLQDEKQRWTEARRIHDHQAEADAAAEMCELTILAGVCQDHLRGVGVL